VLPAGLAGIALGALLFVWADTLGPWLTNDASGTDLTPVLRALAPFLPIAAMYNIALAATRGFGTMKPANVIDRFARTGSQPVVAALVLAAGLGMSALVVGWAAPYAVALAAVLWWIANRLRRLEHGVDGAVTRARSIFIEFWRFAGPRGLASVFAVVVLWINTLLIGTLRSAGEAGTFAAATRYLVFGQFIGLAIAQVVGPKLSEVITTGDRVRARTVYATATWWLMALAWPFYLTLIILAPALLSVFGSGSGRRRARWRSWARRCSWPRGWGPWTSCC
jgi:O-antigen/teichoic acid export membrane protein